MRGYSHAQSPTEVSFPIPARVYSLLPPAPGAMLSTGCSDCGVPRSTLHRGWGEGRTAGGVRPASINRAYFCSISRSVFVLIKKGSFFVKYGFFPVLEGPRRIPDMERPLQLIRQCAILGG